ncbi:MAG: hypothetical protein GY855_03950 [candidate division Zixibacteria bacterium]|nr:hypothetical protein [candidate division Zixibacteria bacterium]
MAKDKEIPKQQSLSLGLLFTCFYFLLVAGVSILFLLHRTSTLVIPAVFLIFLIMLLSPFILGMRELSQSKDAKALYINMAYTKNPLYFGKSFKSMLLKQLNQIDIAPGMKRIVLSKNENVVILESARIPEVKRSENILYIKNNLESSRDVKFNKEVYVAGKAIIGKDNIMRALYCENDVVISKRTEIARWLNSEGNITIHKECDLGRNVSCEAKLEIEIGCRFESLYGNPIITFDGNPDESCENSFNYPERINIPEAPGWKIVDRHLSLNINGNNVEDNGYKDAKLNEYVYNESKWIIKPKQIRIPSSSVVNTNFTTRKTLKIESGTTILSSIKAYKDIIIDDNVIIHGDVFAEGDIVIGENCILLGNLFTQEGIKIGLGTRIGKPGESKSIISKKMINLNRQNVIYGYILTEGSGTIT